MKRHDLDVLTMFCKDCGIAAQDATERGKVYCDATPNVIGVSHHLARRKFKTLLDRVHPR